MSNLNSSNAPGNVRHAPGVLCIINFTPETDDKVWEDNGKIVRLLRKIHPAENTCKHSCFPQVGMYVPEELKNVIFWEVEGREPLRCTVIFEYYNGIVGCNKRQPTSVYSQRFLIPIGGDAEFREIQKEINREFQLEVAKLMFTTPQSN